jgi:hypothetical protein
MSEENVFVIGDETRSCLFLCKLQAVLVVNLLASSPDSRRLETNTLAPRHV